MTMKRHVLLTGLAATFVYLSFASALAFDVFPPPDIASTEHAASLLSNASCAVERVDHPLALEEAILESICAHPQARQALATVRAEAAVVGAANAAYFPTLNATVGVNREGRATTHDYGQVGLGVQSQSRQSSAQQGALSLSWVLFDFGKRSADLRQARELLAVAIAMQDDTLQSVFFSTAQAYYAVRDAQTSVDAAWQNETIAHDSLAAARAKRDAGVGTLSDLLQAQTMHRRAAFDRVSAEGSARVAAGVLAVSLGRDANTSVRIVDAETAIEHPVTTGDIDELINEAKMRRPRLLAARARLAAARANVDAERAKGRPTIALSGSVAQRNSSSRQQADSFPTLRNRSKAIGIQLTIPLFDGFASGYRVASAQAQVDSQVAELRDSELQVSLEVWRSYQLLQAEATNLTTSGDLLDDAQRSLDIARGRYKEGVGVFSELSNAQTALADARKQRVLTISRWRAARLGLAASLGRFGVDTAGS